MTSTDHADEGPAAYWWTHTTLDEEAAPPDATAAEATANVLASLVSATKGLVLSVCSSAQEVPHPPLSCEAQARLFQSTAARETLLPFLVQLRRTMERAWWERRGDDEEINTSGTSAGAAQGTSASSPATAAMDERTRAKLEEVQRQVFLSFLRAVLQGATAAVNSIDSDGAARAYAQSALIACVDGLLTDMCFGTGSEARAWQSGFVQALRRSTTGTGAGREADEPTNSSLPSSPLSSVLPASALNLLQYASCFVSEEPPLSALSVTDRTHHFPLLTAAAVRVMGAKLAALTSTANQLTEETLRGAQTDEDALVRRLNTLATFFQAHVAPALHALGDGLLGRGPSEYLSSSAAGRHTSHTSVQNHKDEEGGSGHVLVDETQTNLTLLYQTASLAAVTDLASGQDFLEGISDLLQACHRGLSVAQQLVNERDSSPSEDLTAAMKAVKSAYQDRIGRQSHLLTAVLGQFASTRPLLLPSLRALLAGPYSASGHPNYRYLVEDGAAYTQKKQRTAASSAPLHDGVALPWPTFADACLARALTVCPSLMETPTDALLSFLTSTDANTAAGDAPREVASVALPVGISLLCRPTLLLQRLLALALSPALLSRHCSAELAITETGGGSQRRAKAFDEAPRDGADTPSHETAMLFFPRLYAMFCTLEASMRCLLRSAEDSKGNHADEDEKLLVHILSASTAHALKNLPKDGASQVAAAELIMFMAFVLSSTPVYPVSALRLVREAFRKMLDKDDHADLASGSTDTTDAQAAVLLLLHKQVVRGHQVGMAAFLLPLLRALGVDHGAALDVDHTAAAVRYPASASVAYLAELPRSYFSRVSPALALHQSEDAIAFLDRAVFAPMASSSAADTKEAAVVDAFVDVVAEAGKVTLGRLYVLQKEKSSTAALVASTAIANSNAGLPTTFAPLDTPALVADVAANVFYGVLRLCVDVTHWEADQRKELRRRIVQRTFAKLRAEQGSSASSTDTTSASAALSDADLATLPLEYLQRDVVVVTTSPLSPGDSAATTSPAALASTPHATEALSAFEHWLWCAELDALDDAPFQAVKGLIRICNVSYTKQVSTQALLRARSAIDRQAEARRAARSSVFASLDAAVAHDLENIRRVLEAQALKAKAATAAKKDGASTTEAAPAEGAGPEEEEDHSAPSAPMVLMLSHVNAYAEFVFNALLLRARLSVVDGAVCAIALEGFFHACARHHVEPTALVSLLRVFLARLRGTMATAQATPQHRHRCTLTRQEAGGLSLLLRAAGERLALPYKVSFAIPASLPAGEAPVTTSGGLVSVLHGPLTRSLVESVIKVFPKDHEAEAVNTLTVAVEDAAGLVKLFLARLSLLADWCAYAVVLHGSHLFRLTTHVEEVYNKAVAARRDAVRTSGIPSPGLQALVGVERPLCEGVSAPAASVARLYTQTPLREGAGADRHRERGRETEEEANARKKRSSRGGRRERERKEKEERRRRERDGAASARTGDGAREGGGRGDDRKRRRSGERDRDGDRERDRVRRRESERDRSRDRDRHRGGRDRRSEERDRKEGGGSRAKRPRGGQKNRRSGRR